MEHQVCFLFFHKGFCVESMSCNLRTKQTVFCPTFLIPENRRKEIWSKKSFVRRKCMSSCYQASRCRPTLTAVCATPAVLLCTVSWHSLCTANRCQYVPQHRNMFWGQVVASALCLPGVAFDDWPAWRSSHLNSSLPESRCLWTSIFVFSIFRGRPF